MNIRLSRVIIPLFALAVLLLTLGARAAEPLQFAGKLLAGDGSGRDYFGYALDADGDTAVVGAVRWNNPDDSNSDYQGSAYVFTRDAGGWSQRKQLVLADGMGYEGFGGALALDGDTLAVGAFGVNVEPPPVRVIDAGAVFVYTGAGETWSEPVKIMPDDLVDNNRFGTAVALSGDTLLAGAPNVEDYANEAAYVYRRNGASWALEDKFLPPTGAADFGASVALSGDTALVCASGSTAVPTVAAVVSVYKRAGSGWSPAGELAPDTAEPFYGCGLAFDGQTAVVVTRGPGDTPTSTAYVFAYDGATWTQTAALSPELNAETVLTTADVAGNRIVLGSYLFDEAGQVFVYERDGAGWTLAQPLAPPNPTVATNFGESVALAGDAVLVGAPEESVSLIEEQGVVYVFAPAAGDNTVQLPVILKPAAGPAPADLIVYTDRPDGQTDIFTIRPDGTGKTNITQSPEDESEPRWSPDGQTILFGRWVGSVKTPMLMNPDGSNERPIPLPADQVEYYGDGTWAPDGTKIAFTGFADGSFEYDLFTIDVDGANLTNLTANFDNDAAGPAWSPDGTRIVFRIEEPEIDMLILDVAGGQATPLNDEPTAGYYFDWSPDGALILFTDEGGAQMGLHVIPPAGGESELRVPGGFYGRWSADGANLVFSGENGGIFRSAADGSGLTPVDPSESAWTPDW